MSWILIANRSGARIVDKQGPNVFLVATLPHNQGRRRDHEIDSDKQGRSFNRQGASHALSNSESPHEHDAKVFARELAERMRSDRLSNRFARLVLVAEPHFLGLLRDALDDVTSRLVIAGVPKDLTQVPLQEIPSHLPELPQAVA